MGGGKTKLQTTVAKINTKLIYLDVASLICSGLAPRLPSRSLASIESPPLSLPVSSCSCKPPLAHGPEKPVLVFPPLTFAARYSLLTSPTSPPRKQPKHYGTPPQRYTFTTVGVVLPQYPALNNLAINRPYHAYRTQAFPPIPYLQQITLSQYPNLTQQYATRLRRDIGPYGPN